MFNFSKIGSFLVKQKLIKTLIKYYYIMRVIKDIMRVIKVILLFLPVKIFKAESPKAGKLG